MDQNTIAVIWDFDKTLIPGYMQDPLFEKYQIKADDFWREVNALVGGYEKKGIRVGKDTIYLNHILTCVQQGIFPDLTNALLRELGGQLQFYKGIPEILIALKDIVEKEEKYKEFAIHVEHYIVSTGLSEMIKGSLINEYVDGIWGCEFIEKPIRSNLDIKVDEKETDAHVISQIGYMIDNTSKTRAVFEINKGVNKHPEIDVNGKMEKKDRRVPFENMVYIADGPSDVPVFSVIKQYGGKTFAIYPKGNSKAFNQVDDLIKAERIDMYAEADYSEGTTAYMWLTKTVKDIAERIYNERINQVYSSAGSVPSHDVYR